MSRDGPEKPAPNPMPPMTATRLHDGTSPDAIEIAQSAAKPSAIATSRSWCTPWEAKKPPVAVPAALPSR